MNTCYCHDYKEALSMAGNETIHNNNKNYKQNISHSVSLYPSPPINAEITVGQPVYICYP